MTRLLWKPSVKAMPGLMRPQARKRVRGSWVRTEAMLTTTAMAKAIREVAETM